MKVIVIGLFFCLFISVNGQQTDTIYYNSERVSEEIYMCGGTPFCSLFHMNVLEKGFLRSFWSTYRINPKTFLSGDLVEVVYNNNKPVEINFKRKIGNRIFFYPQDYYFYDSPKITSVKILYNKNSSTYKSYYYDKEVYFKWPWFYYAYYVAFNKKKNTFTLYDESDQIIAYIKYLPKSKHKEFRYYNPNGDSLLNDANMSFETFEMWMQFCYCGNINSFNEEFSQLNLEGETFGDELFNKERFKNHVTYINPDSSYETKYYNIKGKIDSLRYFTKEGKYRSGYVAENYYYNSNDQLIKKEYLDSALQLTIPERGNSHVSERYKHDSSGNVISISYYDKNDKPVIHSRYWIREYIYGEEFYNEKRFVYDEKQNLIEVALYGLDGQQVKYDTAFCDLASHKLKYDSVGNRIEITNLNLDNSPVNCRRIQQYIYIPLYRIHPDEMIVNMYSSTDCSDCASYKTLLEYDLYRGIKSLVFLDENEKPLPFNIELCHDSYKIELIRNQSGKIISYKCYDANGVEIGEHEYK